jgi:ferredoxin-type protein NapG
MGMSDRDRPDSLLTRRAFVGLMGKGATAVVLGGFIRLLEREDHFLRPPGALPEGEFLALCIRCDRCRDACPYGFISPVPLIESVISVGTPRLLGYCPRCRHCIYVCPSGALRNDR